MDSQWSQAARLVRRTGFGATGAEVDAAVREGVAAFVARQLSADPNADPGARSTPPPSFEAVPGPRHPSDRDARKKRNRARKAQGVELTGWWLRRMLAVRTPFGEKSTLVWHSHFATSLKKVREAPLMLAQNELLRARGRGNFRSLAYAVLTDAATLRWLDGQRNTVRGPNENLSREFLEIFTLGHGGGYTEQDVRGGARALTGWKTKPKDGSTSQHDALHDSGVKTVLGVTGNLDAAGFCDAILAQPASARYVATRLWRRLASDTAPSPEVLDRLVAAYGPRRDVSALLQAILTDPAFAAAEGSFVAGPVEWLIGAMRALAVAADSTKQETQVAHTLDGLGQLPFFPPSVGGWPSGAVWMSTAAADLRFRAASQLADRADLDPFGGSTTSALEALAHRLGVAAWSDRSLAVLRGSAGDRRRLVTVALNTPEYLVH